MTTAEKTLAKVNVSLKGASNVSPWVTVEGNPDEVLRVLWKIAPASRDAIKANDFFGAVNAADAEYKKRTNGAAVVAKQAPPPRQQSELQRATELVENELGGSVWSSGPSTVEDTSVWGSGPAEEFDSSDEENEGHGPAPVCPHGTKTLYHGVAKTGKNAGKPYTAWLCPADRDDQSKCSMQFVND